MSTTLERRAEIKTRTTQDVKAGAAEIYVHWGLSLSDAINLFLVKTIEVGGLPFDLRPEQSAWPPIWDRAYRPAAYENGVALLPIDWDEDE